MAGGVGGHEGRTASQRNTPIAMTEPHHDLWYLEDNARKVMNGRGVEYESYGCNG